QRLLLIRTFAGGGPPGSIGICDAAVGDSLPSGCLPSVAHAPDRAVAVFADQQAAVFGDSDSDRATPDFAVGHDETRHEIFIFAERFTGSMIERHTHDFVTGSFHT